MLTQADLQMFQRFGIDQPLLASAGVERIDDTEARRRGYKRTKKSDLSGLLFPYSDPVTGARGQGRLRRDHPEINQDGKTIGKYLWPPGCTTRLYFPPGSASIIKDSAVPVVFVEAEKSVLALVAASDDANRPMLPIGTGGCWSWRGTRGTITDPTGRPVAQKGPLPDFDSVSWSGRHAVIAFDANAATNQQVQGAIDALARELERRGALVRVARVPQLPNVNGPDDLVAVQGPDAVLKMIDDATPLSRRMRASISATGVVDAVLRAGVELLHTPSGEPFARLPAGQRALVHGVRSREFRSYISRLSYASHGAVPSSTSIASALQTLEGRALYEGREEVVWLRVAGANGTTYLDLGTPDGDVVAVTAQGWTVTTSAPVLFRRSRSAQPLPFPVRGGNVDLLRSLVNIVEDAAWRLVVSWLIGSLNPEGPYPVLIVSGEQGSAKSTLSRYSRQLVDPNTSPLGGFPRNAQDLMIKAHNNRVLAFDNLSNIPAWLSDCLCRLSTGGGFSTRGLYTDDEEIVFDAKRPLILSGIGDIVTRPDLLDRGISVILLPVRQLRSEKELDHEFEAARPAILGALLDAVAASIRNAASVHIPDPPRLVDFAISVVACEQTLGWQPGEFLTAYNGNCAASRSLALEASLVAAAVLAFMSDKTVWSGTATELLMELEQQVHDDRLTKRRGWPQAPNALTNELRRVAPDLRAVGIEFEFERDPHSRTRARIVRIRKSTQPPNPTVRTVRNAPINTSSARTTAGPSDDATPTSDDSAGPVTARSSVAPPPNTAMTTTSDGADDTDGVLGPSPRIPVNSDYAVCSSIPELEAYISPALSADSPVGMDWETTSLNLHDGSLRAVGLAVSVAPGSARYVPVAHRGSGSHNVPLAELAATLQKLDSRVSTLWYNYRFDGEVCRMVCSSWEPSHWEDVMLGVQLMDPCAKRVGLKATAARLLGIQMLTYDEITGGREFADLSPVEALPYAAADADNTRRVWLHPSVQQAIEDQRQIYELEKAFLAPLRDGIRRGVILDPHRLEGCLASLNKTVGETLQALQAIAGEGFNPMSAKQVLRVITEHAIPIVERTSTGQVDTRAATLNRYADRYPFCRLLSKYRSAKAYDAYVKKLIAGLNRHGNPVRFAYRSIGAPTGRMAAGKDDHGAGYADVNIQSIPNFDPPKSAVNVRAAVTANLPGDDSYILVSIDFSQCELRVAAALSEEPTWHETFHNPDGDIHLTNARIALSRPELTKQDKGERARGKVISFAVLYGAGRAAVAEAGGITVAYAESLIRGFFRGLPTLARWMEDVRIRAERDNAVATAFGRIRSLPLDKFASRAKRAERRRDAVNTVIQGTAADLFKMGCVRVHKLVEKNGWQEDCQQLIWLHDELVLRVRQSRLVEILPVVVGALEWTPPGWKVPLKVDVRVGANWGELTDYDLRDSTTDRSLKPSAGTLTDDISVEDVVAAALCAA